MNVYDFDQTVFNPDCSFCFFLYSLRHHPRAVSTALPVAFWQLLLFLKNGKKDAKKLKEALFSYLNRIDDVLGLVDSFWEENFSRIEPWYLEQKRDDDLIISASPAFLLEPAAEKLGVRLLATPMNPYTGKIHGKNCHDQEKLRRFREKYAEAAVEEFYSDSLSDAPMAEIAHRAFLVVGTERKVWPEKNKGR